MRMGWLAFSAVLLLGAPSLAEQAVEAPDPLLGCWTHIYDAAHLAKHPGQKVTALTLAISAREPQGDSDPGKYLAKVTAKMRNAGDTYSNLDGSRCSLAADRLSCVTDGFFIGKFSLAPAAKNMKLGLKGDEHLALVPGVDLAGFAVLSAENPEHALFLLQPAPATACGARAAAQP
jgi:hypothetical protein